MSQFKIKRKPDSNWWEYQAEIDQNTPLGEYLADRNRSLDFTGLINAISEADALARLSFRMQDILNGKAVT